MNDKESVRIDSQDSSLDNSPKKMVYEIRNDEEILAILVKSRYKDEGISFFTPDEYSQQLAYMHHPAGHVIAPHVHNEVRREVLYTKEVLVIKKGRLRCDFYTDTREYIKSIEVFSGDVLLLASGGHGFVCLEETEMYEIKQGPYTGEKDKTRFEAISESEIKVDQLT